MNTIVYVYEYGEESSAGYVESQGRRISVEIVSNFVVVLLQLGFLARESQIWEESHD